MLTAEEVSAFLAKDASDSLKQQAREGQRYYDGDHDIRRYRLYCRDRDGHLVEEGGVLDHRNDLGQEGGNDLPEGLGPDDVQDGLHKGDRAGD